MRRAPAIAAYDRSRVLRRAAMPAAVVLALALAAAGCGGGDGERGAAAQAPRGDYGPAEPGRGERPRPPAPPVRAPGAEVEAALAAGAVGVVGVEGEVGVRPRSLDVSADGTLERIAWESWGGRSASGRGRLRLLECDPTCASGTIVRVPATVRLSRPRLCGRAAYFDRAEVAVQDAAPPATYVRAPC